MEQEGGEVVHLHAYLYWSDGKGVRLSNTEPLTFEGAPPRVDKCTCYGQTPMARAAAMHGLWYVAVRKRGTLEVAANYHAGRDYEARPEWAVALWRQRKLDHGAYLAMSAQFREGHSSRKRDVVEVVRDEKAAATRTRVEVVSKALEDAGRLLPMRQFAVIDAFVASFAEAAAWRRPILVLIGPTGTGKSMLAADALRRVGDVLGVRCFVEVTVENESVLDFSDFDSEQQAGVLLDGAGDVLLIQQNREALQGRPKLTKAGKSASMMYAFEFSLCRRAVVVTMDLSAKNLHLFETDHWLSDPRNVLLLRLDGPAWVGDSGAPNLVPLGHPAASGDDMRTWGPRRVAAWMDAHGFLAPSRVCLENAVAGADLCEMHVEDLVNGLRILPWAAAKLLSMRDAHVATRAGR